MLYLDGSLRSGLRILLCTPGTMDHVMLSCQNYFAQKSRLVISTWFYCWCPEFGCCSWSPSTICLGVPPSIKSLDCEAWTGYTQSLHIYPCSSWAEKKIIPYVTPHGKGHRSLCLTTGESTQWVSYSCFSCSLYFFCNKC